MSDTVILSTIIILFVSLGAILPFVHEAFDQDTADFDGKNIEFESGQSSDISIILEVLTSIITMFFWTFGNIPAILDLIIFVPLRIIFLILLFKLARGVGG